MWLRPVLILSAVIFIASCSSDGAYLATVQQLQNTGTEPASTEFSCESAFDEYQHVTTTRFPEEYYWRGWPHEVHEVDGPLDLDGNGELERVFIGTYVPGSGMSQHRTSSLIIIAEASPLFENIDPDRLKEIFSRRENIDPPIAHTERLPFSNFLSHLELKPDGKNRKQRWTGKEYAAYFNKRGVFTKPLEKHPFFRETRVSVVSVGDELMLLLDVNDIFRPPANEIVTDYRFLARYLGDHTLQVLCGEHIN